jgi:hypothetical protein
VLRTMTTPFFRASRFLLMLGLTKTNDTKELQRMLYTY